jgi:chromosome segregation ATPase
VRIPGSSLAAVVLLASLALSACGSGEADEALVAAQRRADDALADLEQRTDELETELGGLRADGEDLTSRLDALAARLRQRTRRLEDAIATAKGSASSAAGEAADALGTASEAAREISVLTNRLNYHLRNHGDG